MSRPTDPTDPTAGTGDDYAGPPPRPDPWTTKEPHEGMRDNHRARVISLAPDVCLTPCGSGSVPVPYPIVDYGDHMANYADSVRFTKQRVMVLKSNTTHVHGDEAGKDGGIKSGTYKGITEPIGHAPRVYAGKSPVIRDGDRHWMNYRNTVGEANFKLDLSTYDPPLDDDQIPGSMKRVQYALNDTNLKSDAPPPETSYKAAPSNPSILKRLGRFGLKWGGGLAGRTARETIDPDSTQQPWEDNLPADQFEADTYARAKQFQKDGYDTDEIKKWVDGELKAHNDRLSALADLKKGKKNVRVSIRRKKPDNPCRLIRYGNLKCPGGSDEAHHVVADRAFRSTARPDSLWDQTGYINGMSLGSGLAICLDGQAGNPYSAHGIATKRYEDGVSRGQNGGMVSLGQAEGAGAQGVQKATGGRCKASEIMKQLRNYHEGLGMNSDTWVRGQTGTLDGLGNPPIGSKSSGITSR